MVPFPQSEEQSDQLATLYKISDLPSSINIHHEDVGNPGIDVTGGYIAFFSYIKYKKRDPRREPRRDPQREPGRDPLRYPRRDPRREPPREAPMDP